MKTDQCFICACCEEKLPYTPTYLLSNYEKIKCDFCGAVNKPDSPGMWMHFTSFISVVTGANIMLRFSWNLLLALFAGLVTGLAACLFISIYVYKTIKFRRVEQ